MPAYAHRLAPLFVLAFCSASAWSEERHTTSDQRTATIDRESTADVQAAEQVAPAAATTVIPNRAREPVLLNFDRPPRKLWEAFDCTGAGSGVASHGVLTIDSPEGCYEYFLWHPKGIWHQYVQNWRGWIIDTVLRVDPSTERECSDRGAVQIWAHDHTNLIIVGFSTNEICLAYPDQVRYAMDTRDWHVYRIESRGKRVRIYVDGELAIDHRLTWSGGGSDLLAFGDGTGVSSSLSQWDYFAYDVFPNFVAEEWD